MRALGLLCLAAAALALTLLPQAALASGPDECEVKVDGAVTLAGKAAGAGSTASTDYWLTDDELRVALRAVAGATKKTEAEKDAEVERQLSREPRVAILLVTCKTADVKLTFTASTGSLYKDIPFKSGSYLIGGDKPGMIQVMATVQKKSYVVGSGTFDVTGWDKRHMSAAFSFKATSRDAAKKAIDVTGSYDLPCRAGQACAK